MGIRSYENSWNKNVVGIGMAGAFVEPMEANSLYVAQACIQLVHRLINRAKDEDAVISPSQIYAYNRNMCQLEDGIADFIAFILLYQIEKTHLLA